MNRRRKGSAGGKESAGGRRLTELGFVPPDQRKPRTKSEEASDSPVKRTAGDEDRPAGKNRLAAETHPARVCVAWRRRGEGASW